MWGTQLHGPTGSILLVLLALPSTGPGVLWARFRSFSQRHVGCVGGHGAEVKNAVASPLGVRQGLYSVREHGSDQGVEHSFLRPAFQISLLRDWRQLLPWPGYQQWRQSDRREVGEQSPRMCLFSWVSGALGLQNC